MMNIRLLLNSSTVVIFMILTMQTCLALPMEVFLLTAGIVLFGALAYVTATELWILCRLETHGYAVQATVVNVRQNRVGWQRLQVQMPVPPSSQGGDDDGGLLRKWTDETTCTTSPLVCKPQYSPATIGDTVTVRLSKDWQHCRLYEPTTSFCQVGTVMTILSLGAMVATGKMVLLVFLLLSRRACGDICADTIRCQDEFETRFLYACLVGGTVYMDLWFVVKRRYLDRFPSLAETEIMETRPDSGGARLSLVESLPDTTVQGTHEMMALKFASLQSSDDAGVV